MRIRDWSSDVCSSDLCTRPCSRSRVEGASRRMSPVAEVLVGLVILVGLIGVVVPILPGTLLVFAAILVWAIMTGGATAWTVFALSTQIGRASWREGGCQYV